MAPFYHTTSRERLPSILGQGLRAGEAGLTTAGSWADEHYGRRPVYLAAAPGYRLAAMAAPAVLAVEADGLELKPDLPSLIDLGAYLDEERACLWWEEGQEPPALAPYLEDGEISLADLLSRPELAGAAIAATGTAAVVELVEARRLSLCALEPTPGATLESAQAPTLASDSASPEL